MAEKKKDATTKGRREHPLSLLLCLSLFPSPAICDPSSSSGGKKREKAEKQVTKGQREQHSNLSHQHFLIIVVYLSDVFINSHKSYLYTK